MENGVEALKIASAVLIFVLAITITISAFTNATQALNRIFRMQEEEEYVMAKDEDGNDYYLNFIRFENQGTREVGIETIVPSIYRAYKENYAIYFYDSSGNPLTLYEDEEKKEISYIDLDQEAHASAEKAIEHINNILYVGNGFHANGLYQTLAGKIFTEKLGEYYMNDVEEKSEIAEVNKTKKRVIVYIEKE